MYIYIQAALPPDFKRILCVEGWTVSVSIHALKLVSKMTPIASPGTATIRGSNLFKLDFASQPVLRMSNESRPRIVAWDLMTSTTGAWVQCQREPWSTWLQSCKIEDVELCWSTIVSATLLGWQKSGLACRSLRAAISVPDRCMNLLNLYIQGDPRVYVQSEQ